MPELKVVTPRESHLNVILHSFSRTYPMYLDENASPRLDIHS